MVTENVLESVCPPRLTRTVNVLVWAVVGVPDNTPPDERLKPFGGLPLVTVHVLVPLPPVAWSVTL